MKKLIILLLVTILTFSTSAFLYSPQAEAVSAKDWKPGRIIDDAIFTNSKDMTAAQIQSFLNTKVGTGGYDSVPGKCDNTGARNAAPWNSNVTRKQHAANLGYQNHTFTCLNQYYEVPKTEPGPGVPYSNYGNQPGQPNPAGSKSAAQIIYDAAQRYKISPRVLLVMLQKESAGPLVTDDWPFHNQFTYAMGAHCPDGPNGANCDPDYAGFSMQMYEAARLFRSYLDGMDQPWWGCTENGKKVQCPSNRQNGSDPGGSYKVPYATNFILYQTKYVNGQLSNCGGANIYIENKATAALYYYTPYQPNQDSLESYPGTGDKCSSYGNRNFWYMFSNWFGPTYTTAAYAWQIESQEAYLNQEKTTAFTSTITVKPGDEIYLRIRARNWGHKAWENTYTRLGTANPQDRTSIFQDETWPVATRAATLIEEKVEPGQIGTFEFTLQAPQKTGNYVEYFNGVSEARGWFSNVPAKFSIDVVEPIAASNTSNVTLNVGQELKPGEYLLSPDRHSTLNMQKDGNLVLYTHFRPTWSSKTAGKKPGRLIMQGDGNLVLYDVNGSAIWHAGTNGNPGARLTTQTDGNLVVYSTGGNPLWHTKTVHRPNNLGMVNKHLPRATFYKGQILQTADRRYRLVLQSDGNLVLYSPNRALWASWTAGKDATHLTMQGDGNLVLYDRSGKPLWASWTNGRGVSRLTIQQDGNLVIYDSKDRPTWQTKTYGME